jgi:hypothetical protein
LRRIIESLASNDRHIYCTFGLYVVLMITAAGVFVSHESLRKLAHEGAATMATERSLAASRQASMPARHVSRYD